ncbi:unnamed protein product [Hydatigera taeniaeformis]|uniref:C2 domain-containing protein n=1 Tax=Hydatigena taeniaeformis TaxID=6205 RepID=A0A0R3X832_HYDTA|nr:unnamed protein product [Hydatigera taeniaeformis]
MDYDLQGYRVIAIFGKKRNAQSMSASQSVTLSESTPSKSRSIISESASHSLDRDRPVLEEEDFTSKSNLPSDKSLWQRGETINKKLNKDADWKVQLHTSESAFNALIVLVVYGTRGNSGPIIIGTSDCEKCLFRAGNIDQFKVNLAGIGEIFKIRLEVNQVMKSELPYWGLIKAVFENMVTHEQITFDFTNRPFIRMFNHCQLSREQVRSGEPVKDVLPVEILTSDGLDPSAGVVLYRIKLYTRSVSEANQQSYPNPKATLLGRYGDTGRRLIVLVNPSFEKLDDNDEDNLEVYECFIEAVYLGCLTQCRIGPISASPSGARLCLDIEVVDPLTGEIYRFPANLWIGPTEKEDMKEASLQPQVKQMVQQLTESVSENVKKYNFWLSFDEAVPFTITPFDRKKELQWLPVDSDDVSSPIIKYIISYFVLPKQPLMVFIGLSG